MAYCKIILTDSLQTFSYQDFGLLTYEIPEELQESLAIGSLVKMPLRNKDQEGIILRIYSELSAEEQKFRLKKITNFVKQLDIEKELLELLKFTADYYCCTLSDVVTAALPIAQIKKPTKSIKNPLRKFSKIEKQEAPELNLEQKEVLGKIFNKFHSPEKFLLHGVTGSGKTEVYMQAIAKKMEENKNTILLIPEIALAPQLAQRLGSRFGIENVVLWHSALSKTEKQFTLNRLQEDKPCIVIGARSGIFATVKNLGLIVVDEEHENTYKQDSPAPRYHARTLAIKRAELNSCPVIFGSATPSVELYYKASSDDYSDFHLLELKNRALASSLPKVHLVDMCQEFNNANKSVFSRKLDSLIRNCLERKEQVILFLNKRGSASHVFCRNCGFVYHCSNCDSKTVYHADKKKMICHHCGFTEPHPKDCPECNSQAIKFFGLGTQKLEEEVIKNYPEARVSRLDSDVSRVKNSYIDILEAFGKEEIDILVGTQMVAKGLDFPNLTLVGVIAADSNFSQLDYAADERGFQLLTQVSGRAGRADKEGNVVFQTYQVGREALDAAKNQDYQDFYQREIELRKEFAYPPFGKVVRFVISSEDDNAAIVFANKFHEKIYPFNTEGLDIMGPSPALIARLNNKYRYQIVVKFSKTEYINLLRDAFFDFEKNNKVTFTIDVDNQSLY